MKTRKYQNTKNNVRKYNENSTMYKVQKKVAVTYHYVRMDLVTHLPLIMPSRYSQA